MRPKRSRENSAQKAPLSLGRVCGICISAVIRLTLGASVIVILGIALLYARLLQGPIALPLLSDIVSERVNAFEPDAKLEIGELVLSLGEEKAPSGIRFRDVRLETLSDGRVLEVPDLSAAFHMADLIQGRIQPIQISLIAPTISIARAADGRFGIGVGSETPPSPIAQESPVQSDGPDRLSALVDGFVGDQEPLGLLAKLESVKILGARLTYDDRGAEEAWIARSADLTITQYEGGARAILTLDELSEEPSELSLRVLADRPRGKGTTLLSAQFGRADAREIARLAPGLEWLQLVRGVVEGRSTAELNRDGSIGNISGVLVAEDGAVLLSEAPLEYQFARLVFGADPGDQIVKIEDFTLASDQFSMRMNGTARMDLDAEGTVTSLKTQVNLSELFANPKGLFQEPLSFDGGAVLASWDRQTASIDLHSADIVHAQAAISMSGRFQDRNGIWDGGLRVSTDQITMRDLLRFWPLEAAVNARTWIDDNILTSNVTDVHASLQLGAREELQMNFRFNDLDSRYLDQMSPLRSLSGVGALTLETLILDVDDGYVSPGKTGSRIGLGGSRVGIFNFSAPVTDADIQIAAVGDAPAVMALIDEPPLRLISKLGADLRTLDGKARIDVEVDFPLEQDLLLEDVKVRARSELTDLTYDYPLDPDRSLSVSAEKLELEANTARMTLSGPATIEGQPFELSWSESYGNENAASAMRLEGPVTAEIAEKFGLEDLNLAGQADTSLTLEQTDDAPSRLSIDADLKDAGLGSEALSWRKEIGEPGRLRVEISADAPVTIERLRLETSELSLDGALELNAEGELTSADLNRVRVGRALDARAQITKDASGALTVVIAGRKIDLEKLRERFGGDGSSTPDEPATPISARFAIDELILREGLELSAATGSFEQASTGALSARIEGAVQAKTPVVAILARDASGTGKLVLESEDAGGLLKALDLYTDAAGGKLTLTADIDAESNLDGIMRIDDLTVRSEATFRDVIRGGGFDENVENTVETTGLSFRKIWVPFSLRDGEIALTDAIAASSALALKVNGSIDEDSGSLDLRGVISPAYGLTGALNDVPLLGTLLSGGEGEGIIAMTFTLKGPASDPDLSINPLSLLTPGFLRGIFSGSGGEPSEDFQRRLNQPDR